MDDRQQSPRREDVPSNRSAPGAPGHEPSPNGKPDRQGSETSVTDRRSPTGKPALTERERRERWPLG